MTPSNPLQRSASMVWLQYWALVIIAVAITLPDKLPHPAFYTFGVLWLTELCYTLFREKKLRFIRNRFVNQGSLMFRWSVFMLILCYIAGLLYTENLASARFELEKKSLLLLFPLAVMTMNQDVFSKRLLRSILTGFTAGLLLVTLYYTGFAMQRFSVSGEMAEFFYSTLSVRHHPGYLSFYVVFAMGASFWLFISDENRKPWKTVLFALLSLWWLVFVFLLSSKTGFLSLLLFLLFAFRQIYRKVSRRSFIVVIVLIIIMLAGVSIPLSGTIRARFAAMQQRGLEVPDLSTIRRADGIVIRLISWDIAWHQWKKAPVAGVGTGDYHDATWQELEDRGLLDVFGGFKNAHNQFLQTAVTCGLVGFIALILWIIVPILSFPAPRPWLNIFFITLLVLNLMVESMLETQAGVLFIVFFQILLNKKLQKKMPETSASGI
jgi:O-antigen ligase